VVVHIGGNAYHGHYVSVIKTQDRGWLLFDDEMVEPVDKHYVRNFFGDKPGMACAYVLFYQETTVEVMRKEQEAEGLAEVALASQEAGVAHGHLQSNGTHHPKTVSIPSTPVDESQELLSLDHAVSAPLPSLPEHAPRPSAPVLPSSPAVPILNASRIKSKEEKEREKKESKEAEKAKKAAEKAAEKEKHKAEEKRKKDEKDFERTLAASKASAAAEEERRKKEATASITTSEASKENGHDKKGLVSSLSRTHKGSKSMSRKSFGFLGNKSGEGKSGASTVDDSSHTAVEGESGPQTPEKHSKATKDRFSFGGLGRKKSNLMNSS